MLGFFLTSILQFSVHLHHKFGVHNCVLCCFLFYWESNKNKVKHKTLGPHWFTTHAKHYPGAILRNDHNFLMSNKCLQTQTFYPSLSFSRLICPHFVNTSFSSLVLVFMLHYRFHFINHIRESWLKDRLSLNNKPQSRLPLALSLIKHWKGELS